MTTTEIRHFKMMGRDPTLIAIKKELVNYSADMRKSSFAFRVGLMDLTIVACGLLICGSYVGVRTTYKSFPFENPVGHKKDAVEEKAAIGIMLFMGFTTVAIFGILHFICVRDMCFTAIKTDINKTMATIRLCRTLSMLMVLLGFAGVLLGFPDIKVCALLILFDAISLVMFLSISASESVYLIEILDQIEQRILEKEEQYAKQLESQSVESV